LGQSFTVRVPLLIATNANYCIRIEEKTLEFSVVLPYLYNVFGWTTKCGDILRIILINWQFISVFTFDWYVEEDHCWYRCSKCNVYSH